MILDSLYNLKGKKKIAQLIDPGKTDLDSLKRIVKFSDFKGIDYFFVGGSITNFPIDQVIDAIKSFSDKPIVLFPGNLLQISDKADAILFMSMISGRNPELLIGNHVIAAPFIKQSSLEVIPTGYILIENGKSTSVEYMSNTKPIPRDKPEIAVATAMAGEMLGQKVIYLEAGSGASHPISKEIISQIRSNVGTPIIVGGGIKTTDDLKYICEAGADILVIGTAFENNESLIEDFINIVHSY